MFPVRPGPGAYRVSGASTSSRLSLVGLRIAKMRLIRPPSTAKVIAVSKPSSRPTIRAPGAPLSSTGTKVAPAPNFGNVRSRFATFLAP